MLTPLYVKLQANLSTGLNLHAYTRLLYTCFFSQTFSQIVNKNYKSITHKHYQPSKDTNGTEPLPLNTQTSSTGFAKDQHRTTPSQREAYSIFPNLAMTGHRVKLPTLHTINHKDQISEENENRGPAYHSTEHHTQYVQKQPHVDISNKAVGSFEDTGFTRSKNQEPVTHYPEACYEGLCPPLKSLINPQVFDLFCHYVIFCNTLFILLFYLLFCYL